MSTTPTITIKRDSYVKTFSGNTANIVTPSKLATIINVQKDGYNPKTVIYSLPEYTDTVMKSETEDIVLEPYTPVTLTVNSTLADTILTFDEGAGTVNGNTITVAKGTRVVYHLAKEGYNTLDRIIYVNEDTTETETLDLAEFKYTATGTTLSVPFDITDDGIQAWNEADAEVTIDWGDETQSIIGKDYTITDITHTYSVSGTHTISITSNKNIMPALKMYNVKTSTILYPTAQVGFVSILTPLLKMTTTSASGIFYNANWNFRTVCNNLFKYNSQIIDFERAFYNTYINIPEKFFYYNVEATNFNYAFLRWYQMNASTPLPEDLFWYCPNITTLNYTFQQSYIMTIPEKLLWKLPNLSSVDHMFQTGYRLASIPEDLFKYNPKLTSAMYTFANCSQLATIPENLFKYNENLINVDYAFSSNSLITTIPTNLFKYNTKLVYMRFTFNSCPITITPEQYVTNIVPSTDHSIYIYGMSGWTTTTDAYLTQNYVDKYIEKTGNAEYICYGWPITSIPTDIFKKHTGITSFYDAFYNCTNLASLPTDIFRYNTNVTTFYYTFYGCTALSSLPADLFKYNTKVTNFCGTFSTCTKLQLRNDMFGTDYTTRFTNLDSLTFYYMFYRASFNGSRGTAPELWNFTFTNTSGTTITPTRGYCFGGAGNSSTSLSNYSGIPSAWINY